ncbi:hypothetical protein [Variibacter gotjawalensis]|uniref:hypothetical protein n=1 Tax=Variibacter gotjawalensis TaxID=1333996 RepID=UPI00102CE7FE|nr:hypothetical protein [Variibacter gotjawalensis]NIK45894.1 hypothetical protein [Variibacter gotjawalensis]
MTRIFWLATHAIESKTFDYVPDFIAVPERLVRERDVPSSLRAGWREFVTSTREVRGVDLAHGQTKHSACASACTYVHAAGIERSRPFIFPSTARIS